MREDVTWRNPKKSDADAGQCSTRFNGTECLGLFFKQNKVVDLEKHPDSHGIPHEIPLELSQSESNHHENESLSKWTRIQ
mmetsp:Transcript_6532/g.11683  ORF Transcript_6532/g.11683 Transcript_6532/m.11683 type:complete len:80 (+) Transcript_6532:1240-1479(+)